MDLQLPIVIFDELADAVIRSTATLDLASGEIRGVQYQDYDLERQGLPAMAADYEFTSGVLSNAGRDVEFRNSGLIGGTFLRQLAEQSGVSNPYLSMIERGLRNPSAQVLQQIAKSLQISAEQLYLRAGIISVEESVAGSVELAIMADPRLTERQKRSLIDVYTTFVAANERTGGPSASPTGRATRELPSTALHTTVRRSHATGAPATKSCSICRANRD